MQVAGTQAAGVQAVAATQAQVQQAAAAQTAQATVVQQADIAVRGAHAPKAPTKNAPISWSAGGTVGIAQPEPETPESGSGSEDERDNA